MNWTAVEDALFTWVQSASGLAAENVVWEGRGPRPDGAYISMTRTVRIVGQDWRQRCDKPLVLAADVVESVDTGAETLSLTAHAYVTGDGPIQLTSSGTLPGGLALTTDYWIIVVDVDTIQLASTFVNSLDGVAIDLTSAGTGAHTISSYEDTRRAGEEITNIVRGVRQLSFTMTCFADESTQALSPEAILSDVIGKVRMPSNRETLRTANVGVGSFSEIVQVGKALGGLFESRARVTMTGFLPEEFTEDGTIIETLDIQVLLND